MPVNYREELREIRTFPSLIRFLRDEMDWPISSDKFDDISFDYTPEELGIDSHNAAKIQEIKRLRPLSIHQPWGIFFVKFEPKRLPVVALRRILNRVALKKEPLQIAQIERPGKQTICSSFPTMVTAAISVKSASHTLLRTNGKRTFPL